jgi:hypothetical protein
VSCGFSKNVIALHAGGDLPEGATTIASNHVAACEDCRRLLQQLHATQSLLKSLRADTVGSSECTGMRREVMAIINDRGDKSGWGLRIERAIVLGFRGHAYALAASVLLGIVSVSVLAHMRPAPDTRQAVAIFEGRNTLVRPGGYRDWVVVGSANGPHGSRTHLDEGDARATREPGHRVYIDPSAYREYAKTGSFPEGTLMVWEAIDQPEAADRPRTAPPALLASVKDSTRFDGGWGFFDFTAPDDTPATRARALPESSGCRACHQQDAETDHVFTQFYPVLRSARHGVQFTAPRETTPSFADIT